MSAVTSAGECCEACGRPKESPPAQLPEFLKSALEAVDTLSDRELEVLGLLSTGDSNRRIARILGIKEGTVKFHVANILKKLSIRSRIEAAVFAYLVGTGWAEFLHSLPAPYDF